MKKRNRETSPAYGMLSFSRVSGGDPNLFGSSVEHDHKISLVLKRGEVSRDLNSDWYMGNETLFEVEMSYSQFAELISSMNVGDGVPVTIRRVKGEETPPPVTLVNKRKQFRDEFEAENKKTSEKVREMIADLKSVFAEKRALKASERQKVMDDLSRLSVAVDTYNAFMASQFDRTMEDLTKEAKGEIEAFAEAKMRQLAAEAVAAKGLAAKSLADVGAEAPGIPVGI